MRLIRKQYHKTTCGPVALVNAMRILGLKMNYQKAINLLGGMENYKAKNGTTFTDIEKVLLKQGLSVKRITKTSPSKVTKLVKPGKSVVIMMYHWIYKNGRSGNHIVALSQKGMINGEGDRLNKKIWSHSYIGFLTAPIIAKVSR